MRSLAPRSAVGWPLVAVDAVLLTVACAVALSPLAPVYGGGRWVSAAALGLALGLGVTLLARHLRLGALLTSLLVVTGYVLVGPAAAAPTQAIAGILPTLDAWRTVVTGVVRAWRSAITQPVPLGAGGDELVLPFVIALAGALLASTFLWRTRWPGMAAAAVLAVFVAAAAFGTRSTDLPLVRGLLLVVLVVVWLRWRGLRSVRAAWLRRLSLGLVLVSAAGLAGWGLSAAFGTGGRQVLRDHVEPPLQRLDFKSPLARYRDFYKNHEKDVLFTFEDLPEGAAPAVRLATMDAFDGYVWNVSTSDLLTGSSAFRTAPEPGGDRSVEVTVGAYRGPWVPTIGHATGATLVEDGADGAERDLLLNTATGTLAQRGEVREGDVYRLAWEPRHEGDDIRATTVDRSYPLAPMDIPSIEKLDSLARAWVSAAGAGNDLETVQALVTGFQEKGYFNDGTDPRENGYSPSGHGLKRLADMVRDEERIVGNDEQYASAMAYVAQRMGLPARVVLGFEEVRGSTVIGDDIAAWVEIPFVGEGWVAFDPTPDEDKTPPPLKDSPNPMPQPYVVQPPLLPEAPADAQGVPPEGSGKDLRDRLWDVVWLVLGFVWVGAKVLLLLAPLWLILLFKWWRRRRRHRAADPLDRISGAWREFSDRARDLGARIPPGYTRHETSQVLAGRFPQTPAPPLAATADRHVFGPGAPTAEEVDAYWADVDTALARMRSEVPWWRRVAGRFSPASIPWAYAGHLVRSRTSTLVGRAGRRLSAIRSRLRKDRP